VKKTTILIAAAIAVLATLVWMRLDYRLSMLEIKTSVQIGMTEQQATRALGDDRPRVITSRDHLNKRLTFPAAMREPGDKVLMCGSIMPAYYMTVHINPKGLVDGILFMED
jgi:hypothetical protein